MNLAEATADGGRFFYPFSEDLRLKEVIVGPLCTTCLKSVRELTQSRCTRIEGQAWFQKLRGERGRSVSTSIVLAFNTE